jgi:hypothetical protein
MNKFIHSSINFLLKRFDLTSNLEKVVSPVPLHILYHTSTPAHQKIPFELIKREKRCKYA